MLHVRTETVYQAWSPLSNTSGGVGSHGSCPLTTGEAGWGYKHGNPGVHRGAPAVWNGGEGKTPQRGHLGWIWRTNRRWAKKNIKGREGDLPLINEREMTRLLQETRTFQNDEVEL